ncbi:hypothetical protein KIN20_034942 [Parelaphostrongylus tenuis]|uniref:Uncharacterized protein n=1 Tax=Parelaphostrongylus tenuis TaxID=148309 RepID=A0AAD5RB38_PARTN|nr:hypothetical protein KIN20_034942 [Parelaphostrongylus tenuis]
MMPHWSPQMSTQDYIRRSTKVKVKDNERNISRPREDPGFFAKIKNMFKKICCGLFFLSSVHKVQRKATHEGYFNDHSIIQKFQSDKQSSANDNHSTKRTCQHY